MTPQEAFETMVRHLRKQGKRSLLRPGTGTAAGIACAYRSPDGCRCAVGCLIPDDQYSSDMECNPFTPFRCFKGWPIETTRVMSDMQCIHDGSEPHLWEARFADVALEHNLAEIEA